MMHPNFTSYFMCLIMAGVAHMTTLYQSSLHFHSVNVGGSVSLQCLCEDDAAVMFYWFKQTLGRKPKLMSTVYRHSNFIFHDEFESNSRFSTSTENHRNLNITHLEILDSATYYCVWSNLLDFEFCEGITVSVKGSGTNVSALVLQSDSEIIQPGGSVTLNCTVQTGSCDGKHSVYWFENSEEPHPGIIYTHGDRNDQCERIPEIQTHSCVYKLQMDRLNLSHAGTYYCAVASCGRLLFGSRSKEDVAVSTDKPVSRVSVGVLTGALAFTTMLAVCLALSVYRLYKSNQCTDSHVTCSAASTANTELYQDEENLHYAALKDHTINRSRREKDKISSECVYSSVKQ